MQVARAVEIDHVKVLKYRRREADLLVTAGFGWKEGVVRSATLCRRGSQFQLLQARGLHRLWRGGRIYQTRGGPDSLRWFWSLTVNGPMTRSDRVATLEEAKADFQKCWDDWKVWAKLVEVP